MHAPQISTTASAGEQPGVSESPLKNGSEHLSAGPGGSDLFPVQEEEKEGSNGGDGSVFHVSFSVQPAQEVKSANGNGLLHTNAPTSPDGTVLKVNYHSEQPV